jgi:hypothetical protein
VEALSSWGPSPIAPWASRPGARPREIVEPDDLQDLVHQIENMKEKQARDLIATLTDQTEVTSPNLAASCPCHTLRNSRSGGDRLTTTHFINRDAKVNGLAGVLRPPV